MPMETYGATRSVNYERETEVELHTVVGVKEVFKLISLERAPRAAPTTCSSHPPQPALKCCRMQWQQ